MRQQFPQQENGRSDCDASSRSGAQSTAPTLSIVTPAYEEAANLGELYRRLHDVLEGEGIDWEWIVVDDHSSDGTFSMIAELASRDHRVRGIRLAKNAGAHMALTCALHAARGDCAIGLAADLQDPPETAPRLLAEWRAGAQVVWAARAKREGEGTAKVGMSRIYYWLMRKVVGFPEMPAEGADFFLLDRQVLDAFQQFRESNVSILALITWMGFRQTTIKYTKRARLEGESGWTLKKRLKLLVDSITAFSYVPIRLMSYIGFSVAIAGFIYALIVVSNALTGNPPAGWSALIVVVLVIGGIQMLMMGVLGEYLWRALDESRCRPRYIIEQQISGAPSSESEPAIFDQNGQ